MASEAELLRLAVAAYEAASEPGRWLEFLKRYTESVRADAAFLQIHDLEAHTSVILDGFGVVSPLKQSYNEYYSRINLWRERGRHLYIPGRVNLDQELCPRDLLERSEFFNDCLQRFGLVFSMGAVIGREGERAVTLTTLRGPGKHPFDETERDIARFLLPHLKRAWTIARRMDLVAAGDSVLDTLPVGVAFIGSDGRMIYWNRAAEEILGSNDGLCSRNGLLSALDKGAAAHLRKAIDSALSPSKPPGQAAISVPRPSLRRHYQVLVAPLLSWFPQFSAMSRPAALMLITDPEQQPRVSTNLLMQLYRLTRKEAALAAKLSGGTSMEQAAEELSITYETARTHLRRIFSKTGTSRQPELLLLIARLPAIENGTSHG